MNKPTLLVLAAGMGSRYGGLKQMDGLGPHGETIIDYSIYDAINAGFGKIVYIVREYFKADMEAAVHQKYQNVKCIDGTPLEFVFVTQELNKIPSGIPVNPDREKPWGTAHAMLMAKDVIHEPFAIINGDDFYGKESFSILAKWLIEHWDIKGESCIIGYHLENTLSETGGVSRGICQYDSNLKLTGIVEHHNVMKEADGHVWGDNSLTGERHQIGNGDFASMNMWGFTPDFFQIAGDIFVDFLKENGMQLKTEYYIPLAVDVAMGKHGFVCKVLDTASQWFGVTFKEDRPGVVAKLQELVDKGVYPSPLH